MDAARQRGERNERAAATSLHVRHRTGRLAAVSLAEGLSGYGYRRWCLVVLELAGAIFPGGLRKAAGMFSGDEVEQAELVALCGASFEE